MLEKLNTSSGGRSESEGAPDFCADGHRPTRVLIVSHSAVLFSGMAEVVRLIFMGLTRRFPGHYIIEQVGLCHVSAVTSPEWPITSTRVLRTSAGETKLDPEDLHGHITVPEVIQRFSPDLVFCHNDPQNLVYITELRRQANCKWKLVLYVNFDGIPVPREFATLLGADRIVTLSEFSRSAYLRSVGDLTDRTVEVMYCPADTERFRPSDDVAAARAANLPAWVSRSAFVLGWIGRNQWRKQTWIIYELIGRLRSGRYRYCIHCGRVSCRPKAVPEVVNPACPGCELIAAAPMQDIVLWIHMPAGKEVGAWNLDALEAAYDVVQGRDVYYTEGCSPTSHLPREDMPSLYQIWDALLLLSGGEGFGVPAWEAMACAIPVVFSNYSSHAELVSKASAGLGVGGILQPECGSGILRLVPDIEDALAAVRMLYNSREMCARLGSNGREFVSKYNKSVMAECWHRLFREMMGGAANSR